MTFRTHKMLSPFILFLAASLFTQDVLAQDEEGSVFVTLFVARQADSSKVFKARKTDISKSSTASSEKQNAAASGGKAVSSSSTETMSRSDTGGSVTRKSDKIVYKAISSRDVDAAMSRKLTEAKFETTDYSSVVDNCGGTEPSKIKKQFMVQDDLPRKSRGSALRAARECEVRFFAIGTLTAEIARTHQSGLKQVFVSVRGTVYDLKKRLPRKVAVIGPVQYGAMGPDENVARRNALLLAGKKRAKRS